MSVVDALLQENQALRDRIEELEGLLGMDARAPVWLGLTPSEERVFGLLAQRGFASKDNIWSALYSLRVGGDGPDMKIVDVFVFKLRKKLKAANVEIVTRWGQGYAIDGESLTIARTLLQLNEQGRAAA